jgi:hypothetical protein
MNSVTKGINFRRNDAFGTLGITQLVIHNRRVFLNNKNKEDGIVK